MSPPILLDVDEVLLDWTEGFREWMHKQNGHVREGEHQTWELAEAYPGVSQEEISYYVQEFNRSYLFSALAPVTQSWRGVGALGSMFPDSQIVAVSCYLPTRGRGASERYRMLNLNVCYGDALTGKISLPLGSSKRFVYRAFRPGIVIDDNPRYLQEAMEEGHRAIAFDRPWNRDWKHERMLGWHDLGVITGRKEAA